MFVVKHRNSINTLHSPGPHTAGRRFCAVPPFCAAGANPWRKANSLRPSIELSPGIQKEAPAVGWCFFLEATPRFELGVELLQSSALPLGYVALWITGAILCSCYHLSGAGDEARTRYLHLGKVALYQMSYTCGDEKYYSEYRRRCQVSILGFSAGMVPPASGWPSQA